MENEEYGTDLSAAQLAALRRLAISLGEPPSDIDQNIADELVRLGYLTQDGEHSSWKLTPKGDMTMLLVR